MRVVLAPVEQAAAFASLCLALYASPLLLWTSASDWQFLLKWDDAENLVDNDTVLPPLTLAKLRRMWTMGLINVYEPFGWMLKTLVIQIVGMDAWCMRVVTLVLHIAACGVLARVSIMLIELVRVLDALSKPFNSRYSHRIDSDKLKAACLMSAALFAVHPVHVQVVAWPSAQPYALAALFANLAIYAYLRPLHSAIMTSSVRLQSGPKLVRDCGWTLEHALEIVVGRAVSWGRAFAVTVLYACALLSKSASILTPGAFILLDFLVILKASPSQKISHGTITRWCRSRIQVLLMYIIKRLLLVGVFSAFVCVTLTFNRHGSHKHADVLVLTPWERIVKALGTPVAVAQLVLWPAKLRPHYQVFEDQFADVWSADNFLPIASLLLAVWIALHRCRPAYNEPQHMVALAYFVLMLLPMSGLVQHGIVSGACDRYALMSTVPIVPYIAAFLSTWIFQSGEDSSEAEVVEGKHPESTRPAEIQVPPRASGQSQWPLVGFVSLVMVLVSTQLMQHWRTELDLYTYELRMDPTDWREIDGLALTMNSLGMCDPDRRPCTTLWVKSQVNAPLTALKARLYRLRTQIAVDPSEAVIASACLEFDLLALTYSDNALALNNAGVCRIHRQQFSDASSLFSRALALQTVSDTDREKIASNVAQLDRWMTQMGVEDLEQLDGAANFAGEGFMILY